MSRPCPNPDWSTAWAQLTGYFQAASGDEHPINADDVLQFMRELKKEAFRDVTQWMNEIRGIP